MNIIEHFEVCSNDFVVHVNLDCRYSSDGSSSNCDLSGVHLTQCGLNDCLNPAVFLTRCLEKSLPLQAFLGKVCKIEEGFIKAELLTRGKAK